jgi:hypothetical protein
MTGFACHKGEKARMFVLSESDEAIAKGYDFELKFKKLVAMIRRKYGDFEYCCVKHIQGDKKRRNYHVIYFGSYIDQKVIEKWWLENYDSHRSKMELIKYPEKQAKYLAGYMNQEDKFISAHFSSWWVFPGWWEFGRWFKKEWMEYPPEEMNQNYHKMSLIQLKNDRWYSLWIDYKIKTGRMKPANKTKKQHSGVPLYKRILKPGDYEITSIEKR